MWSIVLGPDNQAVPDDKWDEFRNNGHLYVWDVYCERLPDDRFPHYRVWLKRGAGRSKNNMLPVGQTIYLSGWNAFGSHGWTSVRGFKSRRYAIQYMLHQMGYTKNW